ncbi:MAG: glycoside hydrolase family 3 C-terminal domain-containing protein, partial [Oscillospiraceae bacterium]|nr:glycoside hydrolase family 3 C-terminal domain-containing protein [Oscillospiraceae bacterium]
MDITLRMSDHALTARAAAAAGIVLLQNKNRTLPLLPQEDGAPLPVAVFGIKQLQTPAFDKTMTPWRAIGVLDGLAASETVRPDALLARKYRTWAVEHPEGSEMPLTTLDFGALRHDCAAAVVVIGRTPERYSLQLTDEETAMLTRVTSVFDRTVLVLAAPGFIELNEAALSCGAIVFLGLAGQEAGGALADVLTAKVMPAGHLSFSWPEHAEAFSDASAAADQFTGYRYFDSFGVPVRYPFGHGLSYGTVAFGSVSAGLDGCDVTVSAELVNTGEEFAASELVQVYVTRPEGDLTRPVSFLDCFQKSRLLAPGESQTVTLRFPITELSVYREHAHAFVLDAGYYDIRIGTSSRACYLAGSIRLTRSAVVQAAEPLTLSAAQERTRPENVCFQFPEDLAEIEQAHKHAIRFSDRNLPRRSRRKGREFTGCRPDG